MIRVFFACLFFIQFSSIAFGQNNISLNTPFDGDTIETKNPLFSWVYLNFNVVSSGRDYYRIIVVELKKEQSAEAGIIVNQPILKIDPIGGTQLFYPYDAKELEYGHRYGWQIQHIKNNVMIDKSEAWEFTLWLPKEPQPYKYALLNTATDGTVYEAVDGKIYFKLVDGHFSEELEYYVLDQQRNQLKGSVKIDDAEGQKSTSKTARVNGAKYYELDLGAAAKIGTYTLIVLDARKRKLSLKFEVK